MPGPQPSPRFDIAAVSQLQSRDGGLTKGGLTRNGFAEKSGGGLWSWQRPALATGVQAPLTGNGLGLYLVGTALWGVYSTGGTIAVSYRIGLATGTSTTTGSSYTLNAGVIDSDLFGYMNFVPSNSFGQVNPGVWAGGTVGRLSVSTSGTTILAVQGTYTQGKFSALSLNGADFLTSTAAFSLMTQGTGAFVAGYSQWVWTGVTPISASGLYGGKFST